MDDRDVQQHTDHDVPLTNVNETESTQKKKKYFDVFLPESEGSVKPEPIETPKGPKVMD